MRGVRNASSVPRKSPLGGPPLLKGIAGRHAESLGAQMFCRSCLRDKQKPQCREEKGGDTFRASPAKRGIPKKRYSRINIGRRRNGLRKFKKLKRSMFFVGDGRSGGETGGRD